jgi:inosose dehydratase
MSQSDHRLRFAYSTINWGPTGDIPAALTDISRAGWGAVELFGHSLDHLGTPKLLLERMHGLVPATYFASIETATSKPQRTALRNQIRFAAEIGANAFGLVGGGRLRWRPPTSEEYGSVANICEELAVFGASLGVEVCYHPHVGCTIETSQEIELLMDHTKELKLCLDASHIALVGEDPLEVIGTWWDRLGYIHLKDWAAGKFVELGRGSLGIDFPAILQELQLRAFASWIVLEQSQSDISPFESARVNAAYLTAHGYEIRQPGEGAC